MNYRKTLAVLTALAACVPAITMPAGVQDNNDTCIFAEETAETAKLEEGALGDKVTFTIYDNGKMIITGSGAITKTTENLENRNSVTSIVFKDDAEGGVTEIGESAFSCMEKLENVTLPNSLKTIGNFTFAGCGKLSAVTIPENTESIGTQVFAYTALKKVTVPDSVKSLGEKTFEGCYNLEKAQIGRGIKQAVPELFKDCKALTELTIPNFETEEADFGEYGEGAKVAVKDMFNVISPIITECSVSKITILDGAEEISMCEFSCMSSLKEVVIPDTVTTISEAAFSRCDSLENITLPAGIKTIENFAFAGCGKLSDVTIPENAESIGTQAFAYTALKEITVPDSVNSLGEKAFEGCTVLEKAKIGRGIKQAVPGLFKDCKKLTDLTIPNFETEEADYGEYGEGAKVAVKDMFNMISPIITECSVSKITILDGAEEISMCEFSCMSSLKEVVIPDTVTTISKAAFSRCDSIETITLPEKLKTIGYAAFAGCVKLSDITIPAGIETIDEYTFAGCEKLSEVSLPEGVKTIGAQAFAYCYGITDIYIPDSVKKIDEKIFEEDRIKDIWFGGSEDEWKAVIGEYAESEDLRKTTVHFDAVSLKYTKEEAEKLRGCGDVDGDGKVDITDLTLISLYNIGDYDFSGAELIFADLDKDGIVTLADLATLRMVLSHKMELSDLTK